MSIESATYINDLQPVNPPSSDPRSQGDDHLRLIKQVLQNQFSGATRTFQIPSTLAKTANYSVLKTDGESVIYTNTAGGAVTHTLPTLVAGDAGWKVHFIKTSSDANPVFIAPPSGTIASGHLTGLAKARRCIPGIQTTVIWDGTGFFATRATANPPGTCLEFHGFSLPAGYEWPDGQTLSSALNYPEYNAATGGLTTLDKRGRIGVTLDNLGGSAAGRLGNIITGTTVGNVAGTETTTIAQTDLPNIILSVTGSVSVSGGTSGLHIVQATGDFGGVSGGAGSGIALTGFLGAADVSITASGSLAGGETSHLNGNVVQTSQSNLQPSIMVANILVVE